MLHIILNDQELFVEVFQYLFLLSVLRHYVWHNLHHNVFDCRFQLFISVDFLVYQRFVNLFLKGDNIQFSCDVFLKRSELLHLSL